MEQASLESTAPPWTPRAILDSGSETWTDLVALVTRRLEDLASGAVLEIVSRELSTRRDIPPWCAAAGHALLAVRDDGDAIRFWIRKEGADGPPG